MCFDNCKLSKLLCHKITCGASEPVLYIYENYDRHRLIHHCCINPDAEFYKCGQSVVLSRFRPRLVHVNVEQYILTCPMKNLIPQWVLLSHYATGEHNSSIFQLSAISQELPVFLKAHLVLSVCWLRGC